MTFDHTLNLCSRRSLAGLAGAAGLLSVLLAPIGCIPVPIGDPETSRIDPALSGVWLGYVERNLGLAVVRPFDRRTWLVTYLETHEDDGGEEAPAPTLQAQGPDAMLARMLDARAGFEDIALYKGWLTALGGRQFLCLESVTAIEKARLLEPRYWLVARVDVPRPDVMELRFPLQRSPWEDVKSREDAEAFLRKNAQRDELYEAVAFTRVPPSLYEQVRRVLMLRGLQVE